MELDYEQIRINHTGGFILLIIAGLGALETLAGGAATIATAVNSAKHQKAEDNETNRHNLEIEKIAKNIKSLSIGSGLKKKEKEIKPLSNFVILKLVNNLKIKHFRGFFMKDELPKKVDSVECSIISLEDSSKKGSHWTAYYKNNDKKYYFYSYGNAPPPKNLVKYLGSKNLVYNEERFQNYNDPPICGHLCLIVLQKLSKGEDYKEVLKELNHC